MNCLKTWPALATSAAALAALRLAGTRDGVTREVLLETSATS